jgi:hypothetical protein
MPTGRPVDHQGRQPTAVPPVDPGRIWRNGIVTSPSAAARRLVALQHAAEGQPAHTPARRRMPVPEFPTSSTPAASRRSPPSHRQGADPVGRPRVGRLADPSAERLDDRPRVRDIESRAQPLDRAGASGEGSAGIKARCDTDLSPGTRSVPRRTRPPSTDAVLAQLLTAILSDRRCPTLARSSDDPRSCTDLLAGPVQDSWSTCIVQVRSHRHRGGRSRTLTRARPRGPAKLARRTTSSTAPTTSSAAV